MLLPHEIRKKEFSHAINGYARGEVKSYLESVAVHFERLLRENDELSRKLDRACARLDEYQSKEAEEIKAPAAHEAVSAGFGHEKTKIRDEIEKIKDELAAVLLLLSENEASGVDAVETEETEETDAEPAEVIAAVEEIVEEPETIEETEETEEIDELREFDDLLPAEEIEETEEIDELLEFDELDDINEIEELEELGEPEAPEAPEAIEAELPEEAEAETEAETADEAGAEAEPEAEPDAFDEDLWGEIAAIIGADEEPEQIGMDIPETIEEPEAEPIEEENVEAEPIEWVAEESAEEPDIDAFLEFIEPDAAGEDFAFIIPDEFNEPEIEAYTEPVSFDEPEAIEEVEEIEEIEEPAPAPVYKKHFFRITAVKHGAAHENEPEDDETIEVESNDESFDSEADALLSALKEKFGEVESTESEDENFDVQDYDEFNYFFGDTETKIETVPTKNDINDL